MLAAILSDLAEKCWGLNIKIQHWTNVLWPQWLQKRSNQTFWKSNQLKSSKYWWEVWIVGRCLKKTKCPQQWGVFSFPLKHICDQVRDNIKYLTMTKARIDYKYLQKNSLLIQICWTLSFEFSYRLEFLSLSAFFC